MKKFERFIIYPLLFIALFYSLTGGNISSKAKQVYDEIVAKKVTIVNNEGNNVISLGSNIDGVFGGVAIYNSKGNMTLSMGTTLDDKKGGIIIYNENNKKALLLGSINKSGSIIGLGDGEKLIYSISQTIEEDVMINLYNNANGKNAVLTSNQLRFLKGNTDIAVFGNYEGGAFFLFNEHGDKSVLIGNTEKGHGGIWLYDKYGEDYEYYGY